MILYDSRSPWKNYKSSPPEMAKNTAKLLQCRIVQKEQQASAPTLLTGGRVQDSQCKTSVDTEEFTGWTKPWGRYSDSYWQNVVSIRDSQPSREQPRAQRHRRNDRSRMSMDRRYQNPSVEPGANQSETRAMIRSEVRRTDENTRQARVVEKGNPRSMDHVEYTGSWYDRTSGSMNQSGLLVADWSIKTLVFLIG